MEIIDSAMLDDIPALTSLLTVLFAQEADFTSDAAAQREGLRLIISAPQVGQIFCARVDGEVVGMVSLLFTVSTAEGGWVCWLEDMVVHPSHRSGGLGSRLLHHAIAYARVEGYSRITLLTDGVNAAAIRFYQRHGFSLSEMTALRLKLKRE